MELDYGANHVLVVADPDVGSVVASVHKHLVVVDRAADVGDALSGLLDNDCLMSALFNFMHNSRKFLIF